MTAPIFFTVKREFGQTEVEVTPNRGGETLVVELYQYINNNASSVMSVSECPHGLVIRLVDDQFFEIDLVEEDVEAMKLLLTYSLRVELFSTEPEFGFRISRN